MTIKRYYLLLALLYLLMACRPEPASLSTDTPGATAKPTTPILPSPLPESTVSPTATLLMIPPPTSILPENPEPTNTPWATVTPTAVPLDINPPLLANSPLIISEIHMINGQAGWGIGGETAETVRILRTIDGGQKWRDVTPPEYLPVDDESRKKATTFFLDAETGWVAYYFWSINQKPEEPFIWYTQNGGQTWQASQSLNIELVEFYLPGNMQFISPQTGWLMVTTGAGMSHEYFVLFRTVNGGLSWERILDPTTGGPQGCQKTGMRFVDEQTGWITRNCQGVIEGAMISRTDNGGLTWIDQPLPMPDEEELLDPLDEGVSPADTFIVCWTNSPILLSAQSGRVAVQCGGDNGYTIRSNYYLYETADSGSTWNRYDNPGDELIFFDEERGLALGREINLTINGGLSWEQISFVNWDGQFSFVNEQTGWAVARADDQIALVKSEDGGRTWQLLEPQIEE